MTASPSRCYSGQAARLRRETATKENLKKRCGKKTEDSGLQIQLQEDSGSSTG